jgi:hypothetical protein
VTSESARRFTLLDAIVLVAAVATGLGLSRAWKHYADMRTMYSSAISLDQPSVFTTYSVHAVRYWPVVAMMGPALLLLRLRQPRPPRRRLFAPAGLVACAVATIMAILVSVWESLTYLFFCASIDRGWFKFDDVVVMNLVLTATGALSSPTVSFGVAAAWCSQALAGRWRAERSWIDRAGRVVGVLWLLLVPVRFLFNHFYSYLG